MVFIAVSAFRHKTMIYLSCTRRGGRGGKYLIDARNSSLGPSSISVTFLPSPIPPGGLSLLLLWGALLLLSLKTSSKKQHQSAEPELNNTPPSQMGISIYNWSLCCVSCVSRPVDDGLMLPRWSVSSVSSVS